MAIEVYPKESNKVDILDVYHLWIFPKGFSLPFGIHPTKDKQCNVVNRGCPKDPTVLAINSKEMLERGKHIHELSDEEQELMRQYEL